MQAVEGSLRSMAPAPSDTEAALSPFPFVLSTGARYLLVPAVLFAALALRLAVLPPGGGFIYIPFVPGMVLVALLAGARPAIAYTVLSAVVAAVVLRPGHAGASHLGEVMGFVLYLGSGVMITWAIHHYQRWVVGEQRQLRASLAELARAQEQLRDAFDETPVGIAHTTPDGRWLRCNPRMLRMLGYEERELIGRHYVDFTHPDDLARTAERRSRLLEGEVDGYRVEKRYRRKDGRWLWVAVTLSISRDAQGRPAYMVSTIEDIDERREAQERLRLSDARFQAFMDAAPALAWLTDDAGRLVYMNRAWERALDRPREQWLGRSPAELAGAASAGPDGAGDQEVLRTGVATDVIESFGEAGGAPRQWRTVRFPVPAQDGRRMLGGMAVEITEQMRAEAALRDSEARTLAIIRGASDAIVSTDAAGRVRLFNPAAERLFGVEAAAMLGQPLDPLLPPEARGAHPGLMGGFARSGVSQRDMGSGRVAAVKADGTRMELEASISQVTVGGSMILTAMLRDITERTRAERRLVAYQLELAGLNRRLLAQEKETTRRLAQALHDELGQTLAALRMRFDALRRQGSFDPGLPAPAATGASAGLARLDQLIDQANRQVREVLTDLRPPLLDELGLAAALENELRRQSEAGIGPQLSLVVDPALRSHRWPGDVEFAAFMVAREATYNAVRHAEAATVEVILEGDAGRLDLWIEDDGVGLPEDPLRARPGHLGMVGMQERAGSIGASLELGGGDGRGTQVHLRWTAGGERPATAR